MYVALDESKRRELERMLWDRKKARALCRKRKKRSSDIPAKAHSQCRDTHKAPAAKKKIVL